MASPPNDQYFAPAPSSEFRPKDITIRLLDRDFTVSTSAGVFSADGLDHATDVFLKSAPVKTGTTRLLDLGCGWGPIALAAATLHPGADIWAVDVNERAVELTRRNAERHGLSMTVCLPEQVPADLSFDTIWSNPPIRIGKAALHELLMTWLPRLSAHGELVMVVGKNLGADSLQQWLNTHHWPTERIASARGFRVLRTTAAS